MTNLEVLLKRQKDLDWELDRVRSINNANAVNLKEVGCNGLLINNLHSLFAPIREVTLAYEAYVVEELNTIGKKINAINELLGS